MEEFSIDKHIEKMYKFDFTDDERQRLLHFMKSSDLDECNVHWHPISNPDTYENNITVYDTISDDYHDTYIDELIFSLKPVSPAIHTEIINKNKSTVLITPGNVDKTIDKNIVIIRSIHFSDGMITHEYNIYIFNTKLEVVGAGIMFEEI
jgi:hypothetical protein